MSPGNKRGIVLMKFVEVRSVVVTLALGGEPGENGVPGFGKNGMELGRVGGVGMIVVGIREGKSGDVGLVLDDIIGIAAKLFDPILSIDVSNQ